MQPRRQTHPAPGPQNPGELLRGTTRGFGAGQAGRFLPSPPQLLPTYHLFGTRPDVKAVTSLDPRAPLGLLPGSGGTLAVRVCGPHRRGTHRPRSRGVTEAPGDVEQHICRLAARCNTAPRLPRGAVSAQSQSRPFLPAPLSIPPGVLCLQGLCPFWPVGPVGQADSSKRSVSLTPLSFTWFPRWRLASPAPSVPMSTCPQRWDRRCHGLFLGGHCPLNARWWGGSRTGAAMGHPDHCLRHCPRGDARR